MTVLANPVEGAKPARVVLDHPVHWLLVAAFCVVLIGGLVFVGFNVFADTNHAGEPLAIGPFLFLGVALLIALGFEFVNGFHDTANAVATVIYTHSLPPVVAVIWSGFWNFVGVVFSTGAVAYSIVTLLPVDLVLNVGSAGGYAMIFALLIAALIWNLGTWWLGLPNSSSHALIGSVLGVGLANQLLSGGGGAGIASGVDWGQAKNVLMSLLISPVIGFTGALLLMFLIKRMVRDPVLYSDPAGKVPPRGVRSLLIFTCTAVSFAHGGNDGQKGMGLIMLILIGVAPAAYALNRTMPDSSTPAFIQQVEAARSVFERYSGGIVVTAAEAPDVLEKAVHEQSVERPQLYAALDVISADVVAQIRSHGAIAHVPAAATRNLRNQMYLTSDALTFVMRDNGDSGSAALSATELGTLKTYQGGLNKGTRYIPTWVKISVALALGLGTVVGWKRIVVTVGEKIGKSHLTYGMGASAELMAASTILMAEAAGMPVSTTHVLSSGVAGAMVANGSGCQMGTVRNIALAWITTLPAAMLLAGLLYALFLFVIKM